MRVLVVNPNISDGVTARIRAAAEAAALPGERITTVAATGAPRLIVTPEDAARATAAVLAAVERHGGQADGIVLTSFGDTGIAAVRAGCTFRWSGSRGRPVPPPPRWASGSRWSPLRRRWRPRCARRFWTMA